MTDCELPLQGPLNTEAILQCLSEANRSFAGREGETKEARAQLATAATEYIDSLFPDYEDNVAATALKTKHATDQTNMPSLRDWRAELEVSQMEPEEIATRTKQEDLWYAQRFREARAGFFDNLTAATNIFFNVYPVGGIRNFKQGNAAFDDILQATVLYARALGAADVREKVHLFRTTAQGKGWIDHLDTKYGPGRR